MISIVETLMYIRLYTFLNSNNIIYNLQLAFGQQYSTSHALINLTENIRKTVEYLLTCKKHLILYTIKYCQQNRVTMGSLGFQLLA